MTSCKQLLASITLSLPAERLVVTHTHVYLYVVRMHLYTLIYFGDREIHLYKYTYIILARKPVFFKNSG